MMQHEIRRVAYTSNFVIIGMPIITNNITQLTNIKDTISYKTRGIAFLNSDSIYKQGVLSNSANNITCIFKVKAMISSDIYNLYCKNDVLYNYACIPDYKTSVLMNKFFRIIKENDNLDLLEESDDDEDFENTAIDKYVDLNKEVYMKCEYIYKFKKWKPIQEIQTNSPLLTKQQIMNLEK
jgi:hypothetical protein